MVDILVSDFVKSWDTSPFASLNDDPWHITKRAGEHILAVIDLLDSDYVRSGDAAIHRSAEIEENVILKGPMIIGPNCLVAAGAYLRGGVFLEKDCIVGPNSELKTTFMFNGSKIAHLSFVGDSIIGSGGNIEAGAIVANYRNEMDDKAIRIRHRDAILETGVDKFGALLGDRCRIGANAVVAPGALLAGGQIVRRLELMDQHPSRT